MASAGTRDITKSLMIVSVCRMSRCLDLKSS